MREKHGKDAWLWFQWKGSGKEGKTDLGLAGWLISVVQGLSLIVWSLVTGWTKQVGRWTAAPSVRALKRSLGTCAVRGLRTGCFVSETHT